MDSSEYQERGREMVDYIADYLDTIRERRVFPDVRPGYMKDLVPSTAPKQGENWENIMADVERVIMPGITHWQSPHMHAYFPAVHSFPALLGDMLANAINALGFTWASSPACTELEIIVMDWLGKLIGLPDGFLHSSNKNTLSGGGGVIQTSASEATFVALLAARTKAINHLKKKMPLQPEGEDEDIEHDSVLASKFVAYCSEQAHSSVEKASLISLVRLRQVPTDEENRLRGDALAEAIRRDKEKGLIPFFVCATLGTTGCCSFDQLEELGPICEREKIWLHVDAAYAGAAFVCPEFRHLLSGIEYAQSFAFNPSKWLLCNFDITAMWVQNSGALHRTFNVEPLYLQHENSRVAIDYMHWQVPLSRRFRSLKLWFVMRSYGVEGLQAHIRRSVGLGKYFEELVRQDERFEIPAKRHMGLIVFRAKGDNSITERLLKNLNKEGKIHMVPASLKGTYVIRFTITSPSTTEEDLLRDWRIIQNAATKLLKKEENSKRFSESILPGRIRRYTWSHDDEEWDMNLILSNVSDHPSVVNGTFATLCNSEGLRNACSTDDLSYRKERKLPNGTSQMTENEEKKSRRRLSLDTGLKIPVGSNPWISPRSREQLKKPIEELSPSAGSDTSSITLDDLSSSTSKDENGNELNEELLWKIKAKLLENMKIVHSDDTNFVIPRENGIVAKQEKNGHYGVEG